VTRAARAGALLASNAVAGSGSLGASAQGVPLDIARANAFSSEFSVSESPAFNMLDVDGGAILRPTTVKELATNFGSFLSEGSPSLPREVGVEFAPGLLWSGPSLTRRDYQERAWWYRTRVSFAAKRPDSTSSATQLAFGVRLSLEDGADLRNDTLYIKWIERFHASNQRALSDLQDALVTRGSLDPETAATVATALTSVSGSEGLRRLGGILDASQVAEPQVRRAVEAVVDSVVASGMPRAVDRAEFDQFRDSVQNAAWNANSMDLAVASLLSADDSTSSNLHATQINAWLTVGRRLGRSAQLLIGGAAVLAEDAGGNGWDGRGLASARLYVGSNQLKVLVEAQVNLAETQSWLARGGAELHPSFGGWFVLAAGVTGGDGVDGLALVTDFTYGVSLQHVLNSVR
jgi:hypothetical protein